MQENRHRIGWIGMGRMGYPMAERLVKGGYDVSVWNRTRSKAEPLAKSGATIVDSPADLASCDILFTFGEVCRPLADAARAGGHDNVHWFASKDEAAAEAARLIREGDTVLVKGSRSEELETVLPFLGAAG